MSEPVVPAATKLAAVRGFIRTASQSLAAVIPIAAVTIPTTSDAWIGIGLAVASALAGALLAGIASALSIISKGIPGEYTDVALATQSQMSPEERERDLQAALNRVADK